MAITLGLDIGSNSIGWALVDKKAKKIVGTGVRIFQEGVNRRVQGGKESSKNAERREARLMRRQYFRKHVRKERLIELLKKMKMYPKSVSDVDLFLEIDPYEMRKKGVAKKLELFEIGRVLYHLIERRGFKSNRKTQGSDEGKIFDGMESVVGITSTQEGIQDGGFKTLGQYLYSIKTNEDGERRRGRYTLRSMYQFEFDTILKKQNTFHKNFLSEKNIEQLYDAIFFQRKLKSQKHLIGNCTFEPKKHRAPKSSLIFQQFRILEDMANIRITLSERHDSPLTDEERKLMIEELNVREKMNFKVFKKLLKLPEETYINLQDRKAIPGNRTAAHLIKVFGKKRWLEMPEIEKENIWHTLHFADDPEWLEAYASENWNLDSDGIKNLRKVSFEKDYCRLSSKAMKKIIPFMENGLRYDEAAKEAGYHHSVIEKYSELAPRLPKPENIRNPIVQQALYELRRVVNTILDEYGKPDEFVIEIARELKSPKKMREKMFFENQQRQEKAEMIREKLKRQLKFENPSREDVQKYLLWEECGKICPYTGKKISFTNLYSGEFEIEHIIPYSRSLNDSMANKTLCHKSENQAKHNKTPFEAYSADEKLYKKILGRVTKYMPRKARLFKQDELDDDFISRQLNDTRYISREMTKYVKSISDKVRVNSGWTTSRLRGLWGLHSILSKEHSEKNRDDHRHHAVDALVVALTTQGYVQKMSSYHKYDVTPDMEKFPYPWKKFRADAEESINNILVSHRKVERAEPRGQLHEETFYGKIIDSHDVEKKEVFVVKKPIGVITPKEITNIVDPVVKKTAYNRLEEHGVDTSHDKLSIPKEAFVKPLYMPKGKDGRRTQIKSVRVKVASSNMIQLYKGVKKFVQPGSNHHIVIFEKKDGTRIGEVVSLYAAAQRYLRREPVIRKTHEDGHKFIMSLSINDLVLLNVDEETIDWNSQPSQEAFGTQLYRVQKMDVNGIIALRHHTVAILVDEEGNNPGRAFKNPNTLNGIKVKINPLGKLSPSYD